MRRDLFHYFDTDVQTVYKAYLDVLRAKPFGKEPGQTPYRLLSFGIGYSFKHSEAEAIDVLLGWLYESKAFWIVLAALFFGISFLLSALFLSSFNKAKRTEFVTLLTMGAKKRDVRRVLVGESLFSIGIPSLGALLACIVGWTVAGHAIAESSALGASASLFGWVSSGIGALLCALVILGISLLSSFSIVRKPLAVGLREGRHES